MFGNVYRSSFSELYYDPAAFVTCKGSNLHPIIRNHFHSVGHYMWKFNMKALPSGKEIGHGRQWQLAMRLCIET